MRHQYFSKHALVVLLKNKKAIKFTNTFQKHLNESNHILNKLWVDHCSLFYNRLIK